MERSPLSRRMFLTVSSGGLPLEQPLRSHFLAAPPARANARPTRGYWNRSETERRGRGV